MALAYVICNLGLNISALALLRKAGALALKTRELSSSQSSVCTIVEQGLVSPLRATRHV